MKLLYEAEVLAVPKAKANNYRFNRKSKVFYKTRKQIDSESKFLSRLKKLRKPIAIPIAVELEFHIKRVGVRDVDNLVKTTLDLLQPYVIKNDNFVYKIIATKYKSNNERTIIKIYEYEGN